ncbi:MAG: KAP family P-loop NTPase fold protein [Planctomycetota bacterium]|jgi:hypothetical protein
MREEEHLIPILDIPSEKPGMDFEEQAEVLAYLLANAEQGQLTVGIFGGYGSGKTTLMDAVKRKLEEFKKPALLTVEFNAWRHDHEKHLFLPLLAAINRHDQISKTTLGDRIKAAGRAFIRGLSLEADLGFAKIGLAADKAAEAEEKFLQTRIDQVIDGYTDVYYELGQVALGKDGRLERRIAVFIDDLDRCVPDRAFALLEVLKSFMDIKGFMFVLGLDPRAVETYVLDKYGSDFCVTAEEYLRKIVQIPVHLPRPTQRDVFQEISKLAAWAKNMAEELEDLQSFFPGNVRQAKRVLNMYQAIMATNDRVNSKKVEDEKIILKPRVLVALLLIEVRWPLAYWALYSFTESFDDIFNYCYNNAKDVQASVPSVIRGNAKAVTELKDEEFAELYESLLGHLDGDVQKARPYLERMGWPIDIESKMKGRSEKLLIQTGRELPPLGYRIHVEPQLKGENAND